MDENSCSQSALVTSRVLLASLLCSLVGGFLLIASLVAGPLGAIARSQTVANQAKSFSRTASDHDAVQPAGSQCVPPGVLILTEPANDLNQGLPEALPPQDDVQSVSIAEPWPTTTGKDQLVFTLKVGGMAAVPPNQHWYMYFSRFNGTQMFVSMDSDTTGAVTYSYGHTEGGGYTIPLIKYDGAADSGTYSADGTIQLTVSNSHLTLNGPGYPPGGFLPPPAAGETLTGITAEVRSEPKVESVATIVDGSTASPGQYTLMGNGACAPQPTPTPSPTPTPNPRANCTLPGKTVMVDATGEGPEISPTDCPSCAVCTGSYVPALDIQSISFAEPYPTSTGQDQLMITMKVASLASVPANDDWFIFFSRPMFRNGTGLFVSMQTNSNGEPSYHYGYYSTFGFRQVVGGADSGTVSADGTIQITVSNSALTVNPNSPTQPFPPPAAGETFTEIDGLTACETTFPFGHFTTYYDQTATGGYTLTGNQACAPPVSLSAVVSRKIHGSAGTFDINLTSGNGIECRSGGTTGDYTLVFRFANNLTSVTGATVTSGTGSVASNNIDSSDAHNYIVNLTGVTNAQAMTVSLSNVADSANHFSPAVAGQMGVLIGDVNASGVVDGNDVSAVQSHTRQPVNAMTFRYDVNTTGQIDGNDVSITQSHTRTHLP
jgi:hypothetical protein